MGSLGRAAEERHRSRLAGDAIEHRRLTAERYRAPLDDVSRPASLAVGGVGASVDHRSARARLLSRRGAIERSRGRRRRPRRLLVRFDRPCSRMLLGDPGRTRPPPSWKSWPSISIRSGASVDRSSRAPAPGGGGSRSGNRPCVPHTLSVRTSCSPSPVPSPGRRGTSRRSGRRARPCRPRARADHGVDGLGARGGEQQRLRPRVQLAGARIEEQLPNAFADLGPAGLPSDEHVVPLARRCSSARRVCVPLPEPSTPSKAMKNPVAGGRFSFGTSVRGWGRDRRYRLRRRRVLRPASDRDPRGREGEADPELRAGSVP